MLHTSQPSLAQSFWQTLFLLALLLIILYFHIWLPFEPTIYSCVRFGFQHKTYPFGGLISKDFASCLGTIWVSDGFILTLPPPLSLGLWPFGWHTLSYPLTVSYADCLWKSFVGSLTCSESVTLSFRWKIYCLRLWGRLLHPFCFCLHQALSLLLTFCLHTPLDMASLLPRP